jgi:hypothetical protein
LQFLLALGFCSRHSGFPSPSFHFQTGSLIGLQRMLGQRINGENRFTFVPKGVNGIDNPIAQHAHTPNAPFPKSLPAFE